MMHKGLFTLGIAALLATTDAAIAATGAWPVFNDTRGLPVFLVDAIGKWPVFNDTRAQPVFLVDTTGAPTVPAFVSANGLVGDGVTDNSPQLQAAATAACAGKGGTIFLPPGSYNLASTVYTCAKTTWGFGGGTVITGNLQGNTDGTATAGNAGFGFMKFASTTGNEWGVFHSMSIPVTGATGSYEKAASYSRVATDDPSPDPTIYHDAVAYEGQAIINPGNMYGRAWSFNGITTVSAGADGYGVGSEVELRNNGSDQSEINTTKQKNGFHAVGTGTYGGTSAFVASGKWWDGLTCQQNVLQRDCWRVINNTTVVANLSNTGAASFTSVGLIGGGTSTATFANNCVGTTGTPYLGGCLWGANNSVSAQYSMVGGNTATDNGEYGRTAFASGNFGRAAGDAQWGWRVLSGTIATSGTVRLTSNGAAATFGNTIPIGVGRAMQLDCKLIVHKYGGQDSASWSLDDALFDEGATVGTARMIGGSWTAKSASSGATGLLTPSISADTTYGGVNISVTATSGGPWDIVARCFSTESR